MAAIIKWRQERRDDSVARRRHFPSHAILHRLHLIVIASVLILKNVIGIRVKLVVEMLGDVADERVEIEDLIAGFLRFYEMTTAM